ncbi:hypothetical protein CVT26_015891 [Gymnopilus dilepis]|uniref:Uncharacterized protein n=1 Tax=Gymnopilus dilepis TaxID=231916 RepID=A0A409XYJ2_9AGAR|nr:hypothetical protein CVT26_015891 [Gymnopilus dilepis]
MTVYTLNFLSIYRNRLLFRKPVLSSQSDLFSRDLDLDLVTTLCQWPIVLGQLDRVWKGACTACALLLPLSLGFLQIDGVVDDNISRSLLLASCLFSGTGLIVGGLYLTMKADLLSVTVRVRWMKASQNCKARDSIDFWTCLALPISSVAWSIVCCTMTTLLITWADWQNSTDGSAVGSAFLTALLVVNVVQIGRATQLLGIGCASARDSPEMSLKV